MIKYIIILLLLLMSPAWADLNLDKMSPIDEADLAKFQLTFNQEFAYSTQKNFQKIEIEVNRLYAGTADLRISQLTLTPSSVQSLAATDEISRTATIAYVVSSGGAVELIGTPTIADGDNDGDLFMLVGTSDTNTVQLSHGLIFNVRLDSGQHFVLGNRDVIALMWNATTEDWIEYYRKNNN